MERKQQDLLFSRCFASEVPHSTPTFLAGILAPRQIPEDIATNARRQAALLPGVLGRIMAGTDVPDSLYLEFDDALNKAIREFEKICVPFLVKRYSTEDMVWTLPCVFRITPRSREEMLKLELILLSCLKDGGPKAAAQLVAAISGSVEPEIAFAAILSAGWALADPALAEALLAAGVAPALVTAVRHAKSFCRDAAIISACRGARSPNPKVVQELRRAGLARALMRVVRMDVPKEDVGTQLPKACTILLPIWGDEDDPAARLVSNPYRTACAAAVELIAVAPDVALEFAECLTSSEGPWGIFDHGTRCDGDPHPPAHLVSSILAALQEGSVKNAFVTHLLGGMRMDDVALVFICLMNPNSPVAFMTRNMLLEFGKVFDHVQGCERWTQVGAYATVGKGLVKYIEGTPYIGSGKDDPPVDIAVRILSKLASRHEQGRFTMMFNLVNLVDPRKLVGNLARVMGCDDAALAFRACSLVMDCVRTKKAESERHTKESEGLMRAAVKAGFIPHLIRLFQMPPSAWALGEGQNTAPLDAASLARRVLHDGLGELLACNKFSYVEEAMRHGLLDVIKAEMCGNNLSRRFAIIAIRLLLAFEDDSLPWLRDAGLWPEAVVDVVECAGSSDADIVKAAELLAYYLTPKSRWAKALGELLAAGFLKKLRAALARVSSGPEVTGERVLTSVGRNILALEAWADSNWKSIAQFMPLGTGTAPGSSKNSRKDLKKLVLKHVLESEEAGGLALVAPRPRGSRLQSTQPVTTTPSADGPATRRVPMGTAAAAEAGTPRQGSPGQASPLTAPSPGPSRESGGHDASVAGPSIAGGTREPQPSEGRERESGSCEEVPRIGRQGVPASPTPGHKKKADSCVQCGAVKGVDCTMLLECAACRPVRYCGRECQRGHWRVHKPACIAMQEEPD